MFGLWESLPGNMQNMEPFWTLCYADDPLSWGDEAQTRNVYEHMLDYYEDETNTAVSVCGEKCRFVKHIGQRIGKEKASGGAS